MKRTSSVIFALALLVFLPLGARAQGVHQGWGLSHFNGLVATSEFYFVDGDISTDVVINVNQGKFSQPPGAPASETRVFIDLSQWNTATNTLLKDASWTAVVPDSAFQESAKYDSATLTSAEFDVPDNVKQDEAHVVISLEWTAIGPASKNWGTWHTKGPGNIGGGRWNGYSRAAMASGTIEYDGDLIFLDTGNPPVAPNSAATGSSKDGFIWNVLKP